MAREQLAGVLTQLRQAIDVQGPGAPTDAELLGRYVASRDQAAFELLVWRHGAMVLHACRRLLARAEDAEDAFQATFLALVRRAGRIGKREALAGWLHTVACRAAWRARAAAKRRNDCEQRRKTAVAATTGDAAAHKPLDPVVWAEVRELLDREVSRLPAKLRDPFVLCYLEGLSNEEAARQLGCPKGTVLSRLARARERLRGRLGRRGLGLPAGLAATLAHEAITAAPPLSLVGSTVKAAGLIAAGQALAGVVSAPVAALTEGVLRAMFLTKLKMAAALVVGVGIIAAGPGRALLSGPASAQAAVQEPAGPQAQSTPKNAADKPRALNTRDALELHQLTVTLRAAEQQLQAMKVQLEKAQADLEKARADLALAQIEYEQARRRHELAVQAPGGSTAAGKKQPLPQSAPPQNVPATSDKPLALPAAGQTDLIQLATAYIDAVRDWEIAKLKAANATGAPPGVISQSEREIAVINARAAERKMNLLREIIGGLERGADSELQHLRRHHERGFIPASQVAETQTRVDMLRMILGSAK